MNYKMATPDGVDKDDLREITVDSDEVVGDINCSICLREFRIPRILQCMHTFCQQCLSDYVISLDLEKEKITHFPCPLCRQEIKPPFPDKPTKEWAAMFKQSPVLLAMLCEGKAKVEYLCSMCELHGRIESISDICITCNDVFCAMCTTYHRNLKATKGHTLVSKNKMNQYPQEMMKFVEIFTCIEHGGEEIKFYCEDHKAECCASCLFQKHRMCHKVHDLKEEVKQMIAARSPQHTIDELKMLETHLHKIVQATTNAQSQGNKLKQEIDAMRLYFSSLLDKLVQMVDMEETHKEETKKKANQCLSLAAAINSSYRLLQLASQHGSDTQLLLILMRSEEHLKNYTEQICCKFQEVELVHQSLELHPYLSGLLSLKADDVAKMKIEKRKETIPMSQATRKKEEKSTKECHIEQTGEVDVKCASLWPYPLFTGAVYLPEGNIMLVDTCNSSCCLYDANFKHISHYVFELTVCSLHDVSMVSNTEVVVSLNNSKQLYFLNVEQEIRPTGNITTHFQCSGIATLYKDRIVVSGINDESNYYWSIISKTGEELSYHDIGANGRYGGTTYLAVDESKTHIYMSCKYINTLFCFNLDGQQIFTYKENGLRNPTGIGLDDEGNIYLVDSSPKLHKLSPDGTFLEVAKSEIPFDPQKICFSHNSDIFFITKGGIPKEVIHLYKLQLQSN